MIYLKKLKIKNLGRFVKQQEIDLFALSSLNQIDGQNLNTGGSSGAGKSSILKALEYVLGVNSTPTTVLKSRYADGAMEVVLVFEKNNEEYTVTRSTSSGLTVKTPTEEISGSNKESEQALLNILEIPQDLIRRILIKRQKEGGFFLNLTPKQSYSFLSGCLGLEEWTKKQEKIKTDIEKEKENFEKIKLLLIGKESYLESTKNSMASLLVPDTSRISILENEIAECNFKLAAAEESLKLLKESKLNKKSEIQKPILVSQVKAPDLNIQTQKKAELNFQISSLKAQDEQIKKSILSQVYQKETLAKNVLVAKNKIVNVNEKMSVLKEHLLHLKNSKCPTCAQDWANGEKDRSLDQNIASYKTLLTEKTNLQTLIDSGGTVENDLFALKEQLNAFKPNEQIDKLTQELNEIDIFVKNVYAAYAEETQAEQKYFKQVNEKYFAEETEVEKEFLPLIVFAEDQVKNERSRKNLLEKEKDNILMSVKNYEINKHSLESALNRTSEELKKLLKDKSLSESKLSLCETALQVIDAYVTFLFQDTLDQIAHTANEILKNIPNVATTTLSFDTYKKTKNGTIKEEISVLINTDGETQTPLSSLSGGEESSVELVIDLAVNQMIEQRTGKGFNMMFFDEPFTGLDTESIQQLLETMKFSNISKKIVFIDHNPSVKASVTNHILITRDGVTSTINQK